MKMLLTRTALDKLQRTAPVAGFLSAHDTRETSLMARVNRDGWRLYCKAHGPRVDGKRKTFTRRIKETDVNEARRAATLLRLQLQAAPPPSPTPASAAVWTLQRALDLYLDDGPGRKRAKRTVEEYRRNTRYLADWLDIDLTGITGDIMRHRHRYITEHHGPAIANAVFKNFRCLCRFAASRGAALGLDVMTALKGEWNVNRVRDLTLMPEDLPGLYVALHVLPPHWRDIFLLCLHTGMRFTEAATLEFSCIDFEQKRLVRHATKTGRPLYLPLSRQVVALLQRPRNSELVFYNPHAKGGVCAVTGASSIVKRVNQQYQQLTGRELGFHSHQCRKFVGTALNNRGVPEPFINWIMGHEGKTVAQRNYFGRSDVTPLRPIMQELSDYIESLIGDPRKFMQRVR